MAKRRDVPGIKPYGSPAGGWGAIRATARAVREQMDVHVAPLLLFRTNKPDGFDFQASHYDVLDVDESKHPYELRKMRKDEVIVRLDADHHGLGTESCGTLSPSQFRNLCILTRSKGPETLPQYALKTSAFQFTVLLE